MVRLLLMPASLFTLALVPYKELISEAEKKVLTGSASFLFLIS